MQLPKGFYFNGIHAGLKEGKNELDLALIYSDTVCNATGVFTQNHFPGEPVKLGREVLKNGQLQSIVINSKISNVATGSKGQEDAKNICALLAKTLNIETQNTLISSTGIIGRPYPTGIIEKGLAALCENRANNERAVNLAATAIMTTDTVPKIHSAKVGDASIIIIAKGSGMIAPNMATMLVFIATDAQIPNSVLKPILKRVVDQSYNCLSIDFDTSTSDTCIIMANGKAGPVDENEFEQTLGNLCKLSSMDIVKDGEGVDKVISCTLSGAIDHNMAKATASSIINSPLVKTMITGADPNWGRLIMAIGKTPDARLAGVQPTIKMADQLVLLKGVPHEHDLHKLSQFIKENEVIEIQVDLHLGDSEVNYLGANLTAGYVSINADYTT